MKTSGKPSKEITGSFRPHGIVDNTDSVVLSAGQTAAQALEFGDFARVIGGPRSGKTTALKALFLKLARASRPESLLVFTANRTAAATLRDELALAFQGASIGPMARTIPSLAFAILRHAALETKAALPELISGSEQDAMLEELLEVAASDPHFVELLPKNITRSSLRLSGFRAELRDLLSVAIEYSITPERLRALAVETGLKDEWTVAAALYERYLEELAQERNTHRYDPASLLVEATRLIREGKAPSELNEVRMILIDDAQELTPAATEFLAALAGLGASVVLFGDPDVATLGFRFSDPEALTRLVTRLATAAGTTAQSITITAAHEAHAPVIAQALSHVTGRIGAAMAGPQRKGPEAAVGPDGAAEGDQITTKVFALQGDEHAWLAHQLRSEHLNNGVAWRDMAVVARSVTELVELENALAAESVPVRLVGAKSALKDEFGAAAMLELLHWALPDQAGAVREITYEVASELMLSPIAGFDPISLRRLRRTLRAAELADEGTRSSRELLANLFKARGSAADLSGWGEKAHKFITLYFELRDMAAQKDRTIQDLLWHIYSNSELSTQWPKRSLGVEEVSLQVSRNLDSVVALFSAAARFVERNPLGEAAEFVRSQRELKLPEDSIGVGANLQHRVSLVTPAGLIGRSFKVVSIAHLQEGIWPNLRPRSTLLGASVLDEFARTGTVATENRASEMTGELRMLAKAVGAASERLYLSAISTEEEQQSQFIELITGQEFEVSDFDGSSLTLRAIAGRLRRMLLQTNDPKARVEIAAQLARLAEAGVPGAHPDQWWGVKPLSTTEPLAVLGVDKDDPRALKLHPSELDSFIKCPLHWFINAHGGGDYSFKTQVGTLLHEALERATTNSYEEFYSLVKSKWGLIDFDSEWASASEDRRVGLMINRLVSYLEKFEADSEKGVWKEVSFKFDIAGAHVSGKVDRIEVDKLGNVKIVDLKTSRAQVTKDATQNHPQLGIYQLGLIDGAFNENPLLSEHANLSGGALVQVGLKGTKTDPVVTVQDSATEYPVKQIQIRDLIEQVVGDMVMNEQVLTANVGEHCNDKNGYGSCMLHLIEQVSYGN
jgi:superfamily I DNA/RNA helicase/RecB family exonuclease